MKIESIEHIVLSSKYGNDGSLENALHLPEGFRHASFVQITLENGIFGIGEAYLGVFAPQVFTSIVDLFKPYLIGVKVENISKTINILEQVSGYWSFSGAARHIISAFDIALWDIKSKYADLPLFRLLNPKSKNTPIQVYGSGGDSISPKYMEREFDFLIKKGIRIFKIRARNHQLKKVAWCINQGKKSDIKIAVDMAQNLMIPGQSVKECLHFENEIYAKTGLYPYFIEEPLGPYSLSFYPDLRSKLKSKVAGGEIITTPLEILTLMDKGSYDIVQPDASVIGGVSAIQEIFSNKKSNEVQIVVHSWGAAPSMWANYHVAFANKAKLVEYPMPSFPLRKDMMVEDVKINDGFLEPPSCSGLGVVLTDDIKKRYPFKPEATYKCRFTGDDILANNETLW